jgi:ABC-type sugar transport system substrate-binding protein
MRFTDLRRYGLLAVLAMGLALLIAACGSSSKTSSSSSSAGTGSSSSSTAASGNSALASATAAFNKFHTPVGFTTIPPVGKTIPKGKTIDFVICGPASCVPPATFTTRAAHLLGWNVKVINGGLTPQANKAAMDQAIANKPSAVVYEGLSSAVFQPELATLKADKIPTIAWQTVDKTQLPLRWTIPGPSQYTIISKMAAAAAVVAIGGKGTIGHIAVPTFPIYQYTIDPEFNAAVKQYCPACTVKTYDLPATSIGTDSASRIVSWLQGNSDVKVIVHDVGLTALGVNAAMKGAGITDVKQVNLYGTVANLPDIKDGQELAMIPDPFQEMGYEIVDSLARYFTGGSPQTTINLTAPGVTWTSSNVPAAVGNELPPSQPGFQKLFLKAWGLPANTPTG